MFFRQIKKPVLILILCVFISLNAFILVPQKAQAQFVVSVPTLESQGIREWIMNALKGLLKGVFFQGIMNAVQYFVQKLAYDAAVWLASGGKGQGTLFEHKNFGDYMSDVALDSAGEFLGSLSTDDFPIDLCRPTFEADELLPDLLGNIQLSIADTHEPRPRCEWNELAANWDSFISENGTTDVLRQFGNSIRPGESGLGSVLKIREKSQSRIAKELDAKTKDREEGGGIRAVTQKISGYIETPSMLTRESTKEKLIGQPSKSQDQQTEGTFSFKDSLVTMGLNVGSMFLNTLTQNLFSNITSGFFSAEDLVSDKGSLWDLGKSGTEPSGGRIAAEAIFADLLTPRIMEIRDYSPLTEFTACPSQRGSNNCTLDASFAAAITETSGGNPITIKEALDSKRNYLHANWPLIPLADKARNQDPNCHRYGYCYSNLVKLRKARIIPIGWELAANSPYNNIGNPVTLGVVVEGFDACNADGVGDEDNPWCHLIDPNWILKLPPTQCRLKVYGPRPVDSEGDVREQVCVDTPTCVEEDNDGKCLGAWGYCTREKNIWRMTADACPKEQSSCETMISRDSKENSYLRNTLDYNGCNAENVGCLWYSRSKTEDDVWDSEDRIYLNKNVEQCDASMAGCTDLIKKKRGVSVNYVKNSSFEKDEDGDGSPDNWSGLVGNIYDKDGANSYHGIASVRETTEARSTIRQGGIELLPGVYTLSAYAKQAGDELSEPARIMVLKEGGGELNINPGDTNCGEGAGGSIYLEFTPGDFYERGECTLALNEGSSVYINIARFFGRDTVFFDAIQLEEGIYSTEYREEGYPWGIEHAYLKAPPDYLGCTGDIDTDSPECSSYARMCLPEDIGCELYTPVNGDPRITAKISEEDLCWAECVGYDLFRQGETNFEREDPAVFLIPQNALTCSYDVEGCDEFLNTETGALSYYSFLRQCSDDFDEGATYYTWEGSDTVGYQLRTWQLLRGRPIAGRDEDGNPPAYQSGFEDFDACTEEIFRSGADPDCREFYDEEGNITYRLYSKTVVVTEDCEELRRTPIVSDLEIQEEDCNATAGEWSGNECIYHGYSPESATCSSEFKGCRAYTGSTGRNMRILFNDTFEVGDTSGWSEFGDGSVRVSTESLQVGGHSLRLNDRGFEKDMTGLVREGGMYTLSFWAKGSVGSDFTIYINKVTSNVPGPPNWENRVYFAQNQSIKLATEWRHYTLGPVYVDEILSESIPLIFTTSGIVDNVYFDNIILKEVIENLYLIKDSWYIPDSCDMTIRRAPLPQAMVGCQEYKDKNDTSRYLKSFTKLCSENAVGCEAFIDTRNTVSAYEETWNARCLLAGLVPAENMTPCEVDGSTYCDVLPGETGCHFFTSKKIVDNCRNADFILRVDPMEGGGPGISGICLDRDSLIIPADKTLYLVNNESYVCPVSEVGCSRVGGPELKRTEELDDVIIYEYKFLKIKPTQFDSVLCKDEELFCEEYRTEESGLLYFKDPRERICEFKEMDERSGWVRKGTTASCDRIGNYRIWRNADTAYGGWVGECEKKWSGCTTLVDVVDESPDYPDGKPYFVIRNDKLDTGSCKGQVSRIEGCVLFHDLNDPSSKYRADATYLKSGEKGGGKVPVISCPDGGEDCKRCEWRLTRDAGATLVASGFSPSLVCPGGIEEDCYETESIIACDIDKDCWDLRVSATPEIQAQYDYEGSSNSCVTPENDSNMIIKVRPDRVCGEWLACRSTVTVWDEAAGRDKKICTSVDLCREYQTATSGEEDAKCTRFVSGDNDNQLLTTERYQERDASWSGMEFSGYSIPNQYQISDLEVAEVEEGNKRLVHIAEEVPGMFFEYGLDGTRYIRGEGETNLFLREAKRNFVDRSCRAYPEQNSPFPPSVAEWDKYLDEETKGALSAKKQGYTGVQVRDRYVWLDGDEDKIVDDGIEGDEIFPQTDTCSYKKATYGMWTLTKYYDYNQEFLPEGICFGGARDGLPCSPGTEESCGPMDEGGSCERMTRADKYLGLEGYCLEYDKSVNINSSSEEYPCLTWRPVEIPEGGQDVYNQYDSAGYNPPSAGVGKYYCLMGKGKAEPSYSTTFSPKQLILHLPDDDSKEYEERLHINTLSYDTDPKYKEDIAGIVLHLTWVDNADRANYVSVFTQDKGNILSRKSIHQGEFEFEGKTYTYWEARLPDTEDGIRDWETGKITKGTERPLFIYPYLTEGIDQFRFFLQFEGGEAHEGHVGGTSGPKISCDGGGGVSVGSEDSGNYYGVRAVFDEVDKFLGFWLAGCDDSTGSGKTIIIPEILKAESCMYLAQVVDTSGENKARTDAVWEHSQTELYPVFAPPPDYLKEDESVEEILTYKYVYDQSSKPFGSAANRFKSPEMSMEPWFIGADGNNGSPYFTTDYFPQTAIDAGSSLGCRKWRKEKIFLVDEESGRESTAFRREGCYWDETTTPLHVSMREARNELRKLFAKSYNVYVWNTGGDRLSSNYENDDADVDRIYRIGGSPRVNVIWDDTNIRRDSASDDTRVEFESLNLNFANPVRIAAPSPDPERKNIKGQPLIEAYNKFTINNKIRELIIGTKELEAVVRFYAWADRNQMPIVSRWIEWNDGTSPTEIYGKYKNHKPICALTPTEKLGYCLGEFGKDLPCIVEEDCPGSIPGLTHMCTATNIISRCEKKMDRMCNNDADCEVDFGSCPPIRGAGVDPGESRRCELSSNIRCSTDSDCSIDHGPCIRSDFTERSFGNSPEACHEGYFEMSHTYICSKKILSNLNICRTSADSPCKVDTNLEDDITEYACVFRPTIRVIDNWGWCSADSPEFCSTSRDEVPLGEERPGIMFDGMIRVFPEVPDELY